MTGRYWRLLSYAPKTAKKVVLSSRASMKPIYEEVMDDDLLYMMLEELGSVASVYYKPAQEFITPKRGPAPVSTNSPLADDEELQIDVDNDEEDDGEDEDSEFDMDIFADSDSCVCLKQPIIPEIEAISGTFQEFAIFCVSCYGKASSRFDYVQKTSRHR